MEYIVQKYNYINSDLADLRTKDWFIYRTPWPALTLITSYVVLVKYILPKFMENRRPYSLKTIIFYYNIYQIAACAALTYYVAISGWTTYFSWGCQPVDYSDNPLANRMVQCFWYANLLKASEMLETIFFILRKKYNQVTNLHVYHHASTFMVVWLGGKWVPGGMASFPILLNSFIHIIMYTYYLVASLGPEWQKRIAPLKPKLTMIQMIQFTVLILHSMQTLYPQCPVPSVLLLFFIPNVVLIFKLFWDFYKKSYLEKSKRK